MELLSDKEKCKASLSELFSRDPKDLSEYSLLMYFWDFIDEKQIANRKEYSEEEQKDLFIEFIFGKKDGN